jgi:aspartyl-tRNA(Asn)/glutamyl-tRNA(Gln) amidotransferase subunit A
MSAPPTIAEATRLFAAHKLSPVELTQECFARVRRLDGALHSFLLPTEERAMQDARAAEARIMKGQARGALDGIPIGHKDIYNTAGIRTTAHSRLLETNVPTEDARTVRLLAEAGTVMMGKVGRPSICLGRRLAIPGTPTASPPAAAAAQGPRSPPT